MAFSAGVFTRLINWVTESASAPIEIAKLDTELDDVALALNNCLLRDGTGVPSADTPWNNKKITGLAVPTLTADAARMGDGFFTEQTVASATTCNIGAATSHLITISGTTTITGFGSSALTTAPIYLVKFEGALTLTYNATSLIIPGAANITTAANDIAWLKYLGSGNWRVILYSSATTDVSGSFTGTGTGFSGSPTQTLYYSLNGRAVSLYVYMTGTSTTTAFTITGLPAAITPTRTQYIAVPDGRATDASTAVTAAAGHGASLIVDTNSVIYVLRDANALGWTASGTKAVLCTISYLLN